MPELAVRRLSEMAALRQHAHLPESWWLTTAFDALSVLFVARKSYWLGHLASFEAEIRSLEESLNAEGFAWVGLMARRLLGEAYQEAGDFDRASQEVYRALADYSDLPNVGAYHVRLTRDLLQSIEQRIQSRAWALL